MDPCSCNCRSFLLALLVLAAALTVIVDAVPEAFAVPTGQWAGIDGNWSTLDLALGEPAQSVQVLASTVLSEFWAVGEGGCQPREPHCSRARGGLFRPEQSDYWSDIGIFALGLDWLGYGDNGHYGLDLLEFQAAQSDASFSMDSTLIAHLNSTDYFLGYFGLGITHADFGDQIAKSPLTQAVEFHALLPSYTYGYTAGAHYRDTPASLTLGGYDAARFADHDNRFVLSSGDNFPRTLVRGIQVSAQDDSETTVLSNKNTSFTALVDSTTPFLWLPDAVCDAFASALNLTYDDKFDLYTLTDEQYESLRDAEAHDFVFSLSSMDNTDDFGNPLDVAGVVNITIPSRALVSTLKYPYMDEAIAYGEPAVPYFALRRSSEALIIGRSFLQEAYLVTEYDQMTFSIHQARFPDVSGAHMNMDIVAVEQPQNGPYPPPGSASSDSSLSARALGGIIAGSLIGGIHIAVVIWLCRRKRRRRRLQQRDVPREPCTSETDLEKKPNSCPSAETQPSKGSPLSRFVNRFVPRRLLARKNATPVGKDQGKPAEVPNHEIFELPCPLNPVELDGDDGDADNEASYGVCTQHASAYEQARLRMDRQLAGPVPEYSPPASGQMPLPEKDPSSNNDNNQAPPSTESPQYAPISPPASDTTFNGSVALSPLSPLSPRGPSTGSYSFPRAATVGPHSTRSTTWGRSAGSALTNQTHSDASSTPISPSRIALPPSPRFQRTPIDPSNVVFLGILPDQEHQTSRAPTPEILHPDGRPVNPLSGTHGIVASADTDAGSFNSSFAGEDEVRWHMEQQDEHARIAAALAAVRAAHASNTRAAAEDSTLGSHRRWSLQTEHYERNHDPLAGSNMMGAAQDNRAYLDLAADMEFVHVPQLPHRRYSWEEED